MNKRIYLYTPAKYENFRLNKKKALDKKIEQCHRDIEVVLVNKHGNFVLELSGGAYELLKIAIDEYFHEYEIYKLDPKLKMDEEGLCISVSYSIKK